MTNYVRLYSNQLNQGGRGLSDIKLYYGPHHHRQSGAGVGNFFASAFRYLRPLVLSGLKEIGSEGIRTAESLVSQLGKKNVKEILKEEGEQALKNLGNKAIKTLKRKTEIQSGTGIMKFGQSVQPLKRYRKKSIKTHRRSKSGQSKKSRRVGMLSVVNKAKKQIGGGRKRVLKKKRKTKSRRRIIRNLDIFQ